MKIRSEGKYIGNTDWSFSSHGLTMNITEYTHEFVDWHAHENPHFTLILQGVLNEENKRNKYSLEPSSLLFHNYQDTHRNMKPPIFSRGAHLEINRVWFAKYEILIDKMEDSLEINNPTIRNALFQILLEGKMNDSYQSANLDMLVINLFHQLAQERKVAQSARPPWLESLLEYIQDNIKHKFSLAEMSKKIGVHPVHLSRTFHKYQQVSFGQYCREIRLNNAICDIMSKKWNLTEIAHRNNYFDQSHMIGAFQKKYGLTPRMFLQLTG